MPEKLSLDFLKGKIAEKNAGWKAGKTTLSQMAPEKRRLRLGLQPTGTEMGIIKKMALHKETESRYLRKPMALGAKATGVPSKADWSTYATKVKNQGECGACVAFGTLGALEALLKIHYYKNAKKDVNLSEAHLFSCGGGTCDEGWHPKNACVYLKKNGVPDDACFPYREVDQDCADTCKDWKKRIGPTKILSYRSSRNMTTIKKKISTNGPQVGGIAVYSDFFSYTSGVYQHVSGGLEGYHCIAIFGYDDVSRCWICKNSWNTDWGDDGWFKIGYGECGIEDAFGMYNMVVPEK
jgi:C1A family cysteine protease